MIVLHACELPATSDAPRSTRGPAALHNPYHFFFLPALSNLTISVRCAARVSGRLAPFDTPDVIGVERERAKGSGS